MKKTLVYSIILFLFMTKSVSANVFFSEIAWMGTTISSTNEWIELTNDGDQSQSLDGWKIVSDDNNITINLSGTISAKGYYLIERTDDDSVPNISADLVATFGHGLSNDGETLYLKNDTGAIIESLNYVSGWPAGDVATKDTMQKSGGVWVTASPTPKANGASTANQSTTTSTTSTTNTGSGLPAPSNQVAQKKEPILPKETIIISAPKSIAVNLPIKVSAKVFGSWNENITTGYFVWSMGDGKSFTTNYLDKITYHYEYAGTYAVSLSYFVSKYQLEPTYTNSTIISVSKNNLSIVKDTDLLRIKNSGQDDIDLSQFKLVDGNNTFVFPFGMRIVSTGEIFMTQSIAGFPFMQPILLSKDGTTVASLVPVEVPIPVTENLSYVVKDPVYIPVVQSTIKQTDNSVDLNAIDTDTLGANSASSDIKIPTWLIVVLLVLVLVVSAFVMRFYKKEKSSADDEFSLVDE